MRRTLAVLATTLFQRDASSGRMLFLGCLAVLAIMRIDPDSAARPPAAVAFFGWMGVHLMLRYLRVRTLLVAAGTARHKLSDLSGRGPPLG